MFLFIIFAGILPFVIVGGLLFFLIAIILGIRDVRREERQSKAEHKLQEELERQEREKRIQLQKLANILQAEIEHKKIKE